MKMENKVVLISGSTQGIGKALAELLAAEGARVVINGRDADRLETVVAEFREKDLAVTGIAGDVSKPEDCQEIIEGVLSLFGRLDILVNNAGISVAAGYSEEVNPLVYRKAVETNYLGTVYLTCAALPHLRRTRGSVMIVSSLAGLLGFPGNAAYCSAKMALTGFAESLKQELRGTGVHTGIAYVAYTENTEGKKVLAPSGELEPKKHIYRIRLEPIGKVAQQLADMIRRRKYKSVFTFSGKMLNYMNRFFPGILRLMLTVFFARKLQRYREAQAAEWEGPEPDETGMNQNPAPAEL